MDPSIEFRSVVERRFGLRLDAEQAQGVLRSRSRKLGIEAEAYVDRLDSFTIGMREFDQLIAELTIGETCFFRHMVQLEAVIEDMLPAIAEKRDADETIRLLSAGCSSGEEPYSLAMMIERHLPHLVDRVEIVGVDLDERALTRARSGRYAQWSLRETPGCYRSDGFIQSGKEFLVAERFRQRVRFAQANLIDHPSGALANRVWDVVICRNVFIYFGPETIGSVVDAIGKSMRRDGFLLLGPSETLRGLGLGFLLHQHRGAFSYRLSGAPRASGRAAAPAGAGPRLLPVLDVDVSLLDQDGHWVSGIAASTDRVRAMSGPGPHAPPSDDPLGRRRHIAGLVADGRIDEALSLLDAALLDRPGSGEIRLLRLAVLSNGSARTTLEEACLDLIGMHPSAEAHLLLGLCRESVGRMLDAAESYRASIHADPGFAMPRLFYGMIARRLGDVQLAAREIRHAMRMLRVEDPERLTLFGGGFQRSALMDLARNEIEGCGVDAHGRG